MATTAITSTQTPTVVGAAQAPKQPAPAKAATNPPAASSAAPAAGSSVSISSAAVAALKEATETPAQTAKEASGGDRAAKALVAKAAAQAARYKQ